MNADPETTPTRDAEPPTPPERGAKRFLGRFALLAAGDLLGKVLAYAGMVIVVRHFGAAGYGALGFATSVVTCALTAATFGLDLYAVRETARHPARLGTLAGTMVALRVLFGLIAYAALLLAAAVVPSLEGVSSLLAISGVSLLVSGGTLNWAAEGRQRAGLIALTNLSVQGVNLLLILAVISGRVGLWGVAAAQVLAEAAAAIGLLVWAARTFPKPWGFLPRNEWGAALAQAAPMGWARVMRALTVASDLIVLGFLMPLEDVGWYGGAYRLFLLFFASVGLYSVLLLPRLSACATAGEPAVWHEVRASFRRILPPAAVCVAVAAWLAHFLLVTMFGPTFGVAAPALQWLLLSLFVSLVSGHFRLSLMALGRQREDSVAVTLTALAHLGLKVALIPLLEITGAAVGNVLGEVVLLIIVICMVRFPRGGDATAPPGSS